MSAIEAGYAASGGIRKSMDATMTPLFASGSLITASLKRSSRIQAPPWTETTIGKGPPPFGVCSRASKGLSLWRRYSTSLMSISWLAMRSLLEWLFVAYAAPASGFRQASTRQQQARRPGARERGGGHPPSEVGLGKK